MTDAQWTAIRSRANDSADRDVAALLAEVRRLREIEAAGAGLADVCRSARFLFVDGATAAASFATDRDRWATLCDEAKATHARLSVALDAWEAARRDESEFST